MRLEGANTKARAEGLEETPARSNYLVGRDPRRWQTGVPNYGRVRYEVVYRGVDLVYYGNQRQLEYDFHLAAGADPAAIRLSFKGARGLKLDARGDLLIATAAGTLRQHKPVAYQTVDGARREVECEYALGRGGRVFFRLGAYDTSRALVIDPVLTYATYLGGNNTDEANAVAVNQEGNAYVVGTTASMNFPVTPGAFQTTLGGTVTFSYDAFVTKLNPEGTAIIYSTFLGGGYGDYGHAVVVNNYGEAHVAGETRSPNFPVTANSFQAALRGELDAFVTKLDADGSSLLYATYLGGSQNEYGPSLALNSAGHVFVAGRTFSPDFPVTPIAFQTAFGGGNCPAAPCSDGFVTRLRMMAYSGPVFSTFLGGTRDDVVEGVAVMRQGGGDYAVTVTKPDTFWTFAPPSRSVTNAQQTINVFNFTALRPLLLGGRITDEWGNGLSGVTVRLSGTLSADGLTDPGGWFSFHDLPRGGTYTVTPEHEFYNFTPAAHTFENIDADQLRDFTAAYKRHRIGGRVTDASGAGLGGVTVELSGYEQRAVVTSADGGYSFDGLLFGRPYVVRASRAGWSLAPESHPIEDLRADVTADFSAARLAYTVSGRVADAQDGSGLAGALPKKSGAPPR